MLFVAPRFIDERRAGGDPRTYGLSHQKKILFFYYHITTSLAVGLVWCQCPKSPDRAQRNRTKTLPWRKTRRGCHHRRTLLLFFFKERLVHAQVNKRAAGRACRRNETSKTAVQRLEQKSPQLAQCRQRYVLPMLHTFVYSSAQKNAPHLGSTAYAVKLAADRIPTPNSTSDSDITRRHASKKKKKTR